MDVFQTALFCGAAVTALVAWHVPNALFWITLGWLSFFTSAVWQAYGLPYRELFGTVTNVIIIVSIYKWGERRWEVLVMDAFIAMILLNFLFSVGLIPTNYMLITALEVCNWFALVVIFITGYTERQHGTSRLTGNPGWADRLHSTLYAQRRSG